jgi:predicted transcriptional regulator
MVDYAGASSTKRSSAVKIMLHPDMAQKLRALADHLGQTPATLASIAVSQYVAQQTAALETTARVVEGFFEHIAPEVLNSLQKRLGDLVQSQNAEVFKAQPQPVYFPEAEKQEYPPKRTLSASEALAEALKQSAALVKAEESIR